jgi:fused signal recognition particle receptor
VAGKSTVDEEVLDNLEDALVSADVGVDTTIEIIKKIEERVARDKYLGTSELNKILKEEIEQLLVDAPASNSYAFDSDLPTKPYIILVVGVNGVGKTTTIGKLAYNFKEAWQECFTWRCRYISCRQRLTNLLSGVKELGFQL